MSRTGADGCPSPESFRREGGLPRTPAPGIAVHPVSGACGSRLPCRESRSDAGRSDRPRPRQGFWAAPSLQSALLHEESSRDVPGLCGRRSVMSRACADGDPCARTTLGTAASGQVAEQERLQGAAGRGGFHGELYMTRHVATGHAFRSVCREAAVGPNERRQGREGRRRQRDRRAIVEDQMEVPFVRQAHRPQFDRIRSVVGNGKSRQPVLQVQAYQATLATARRSSCGAMGRR